MYSVFLPSHTHDDRRGLPVALDEHGHAPLVETPPRSSRRRPLAVRLLAFWLVPRPAPRARPRFG